MTEKANPGQLNVFSFNCWGLKYIATHRHARLSEIGRQIAALSPAPHIVALQECWTQQDFLSIANSCSTILPHAKFYYSGSFGGGLAILSKWPIVESNMYRYPLNGRPSAFWRGDWYVGKGVAGARIEVSRKELGINGDGVQMIEVFCTHLHAPYEREPNDSYICHRTAQAWEIAKLMRGAAARGSLVLGMGDFNMLPMSFAHRIITAHAPVEDAWRVIHPESSLGPSTEEIEKKRRRGVPTVERSINYDGHTCDSVSNTWRWGKQRQKRLDRGEDVVVAPETEDPRAKRLDYIFVGDGQASLHSRHGDANTNHRLWTVTSVSVQMTQRHPKLKCSLSDHFAVAATLSYVPHASSSSTSSSASDLIHAPPPHTSTGSTIPRNINSERDIAPLTLPVPSLYPSILTLIEKYTARERRQRTWRIAHFWIGLAVSIGCWIATWWSPHNGVGFALNVLSTLGLATGVIDGLIGFLFVGSELRALKEFEWEVRNDMERKGKEDGV